MRKKKPKQKPNKPSGNNSLKKALCSTLILRVMTLLRQDKELERNRPRLRHGCVQLAPVLRGPSWSCAHTHPVLKLGALWVNTGLIWPLKQTKNLSTQQVGALSRWGEGCCPGAPLA